MLTERAHGIDISKYDLYFKPETATQQLDFVIQRVSYGLRRDEAFDALLPGVNKVAIRGAYHYLSSNVLWQTQADRFIGYTSVGDYHFHVCDFEDAFNVMSMEFAYMAWQWIHYVKSKTMKPVFIYTGWSTYSEYIYPSEKRYGINWDVVPYWQAQWKRPANPNGTPDMPEGRTAGWKLWQYTEQGNGPLFGTARPTACDLNVYNGTPQDMTSWLGVNTTPPPPGGTMKGVALVTINIRDANNVIVDKLYKGDAVYGEVKIAFGLNRIFFDKVYRVDGSIQSFADGSNAAIGDGTVNFMTLTNEPEPVPSAGKVASIEMELEPGSVVRILDADKNVIAIYEA
jgi:GH25 family lysozyme M1 (1,4-beta-N-acetylmuramidase)